MMHLVEPAYFVEAFGLGLVLLGAGTAGTLLHASDFGPLGQRTVAGAVLGASVLGLIYSPWGRRSGAHFNPAFTLTFLRLGRMRATTAYFYVLAQTAGGLAGILLTYLMFGDRFASPPVSFLVTVPLAGRVTAAFMAEALLAFALMALVLWISPRPRLAPYTGVVVSVLLAVFVVIEAPLSGMSLNPARSLASALVANTWTSFWIYLVAPSTGMLAAAEIYVRRYGLDPEECARISPHHARRPCVLCGRDPMADHGSSPGGLT